MTRKPSFLERLTGSSGMDDFDEQEETAPEAQGQDDAWNGGNELASIQDFAILLSQSQKRFCADQAIGGQIVDRLEAEQKPVFTISLPDEKIGLMELEALLKHLLVVGVDFSVSADFLGCRMAQSHFGTAEHFDGVGRGVADHGATHIGGNADFIVVDTKWKRHTHLNLAEEA